MKKTTMADTAKPGTEVTKLPWVKPLIDDLPRLTDLTLQTGSPIGGGGDTSGGGGSVF